MTLIPRDKIPKKVCFLLVVVALALLVAMLDSKGSVTTYKSTDKVAVWLQPRSHYGSRRYVFFFGIKNYEAKSLMEGALKSYLLLQHFSGQYMVELASAS